MFDTEVALRYALSGGEDYELLLVAGEEAIAEANERSDVPITVIGKMIADAEPRVKLLDASGREIAAPAGWDHLRADRREVL